MNILYFGALKEKINQSTPLLDTITPISVVGLRRGLNSHHKTCLFDDNKILCAVNQEIVDNDYLIQTDDEVAFFPPMTGG